MTDWGQLRICVQKPHPQDSEKIRSLRDKSSSDVHFQKLKAAFLVEKIWTNTPLITIQFLSDPNDYTWTDLKELQDSNNTEELDPLERVIRNDPTLKRPINAVKKVFAERIENICGLKFQFVDTDGMIRIDFKTDGGSWSYVGNDCLSEKDPKKPTLNYGWLDVPTITHELCHAIGMIHEHQNPNNNTINWDDKKVYEWALSTQGWDKTTAYDNIIQKYSTNSINGSNYDPLSVMLYFFPVSLTKDGIGTKMNLHLSDIDVQWINGIYPGGKDNPETWYTNTFHLPYLDYKSGMKTGTKIMIALFSVLVIATIIITVIIIHNKKKHRK